MTTKELLEKLQQSRSTRSSELLRQLGKEKNIFIIHNVSSSVYADDETLISFINHKEKGIRFNIAQNEGASVKVLKLLTEHESDKEVLEEIIHNKRCTKALKVEVMKKLTRLGA